MVNGDEAAPRQNYKYLARKAALRAATRKHELEVKDHDLAEVCSYIYEYISIQIYVY